MAESSVKKVSRLICESADANKLIGSIREAVKGDFRIEYSYRVAADGKNECIAAPKSILRPDVVSFGQMNDIFRYGNYPFCLVIAHMHNEFVLQGLVDSTFGVRVSGKKNAKVVPTYNLKKDKVYEQVKTDFPDYVNRELFPDVNKKGMELDKQIREFFSSEECATQKMEFRRQHIVNHLRDIMVKFPDVTADIIQQASNEAICQLVTGD